MTPHNEKHLLITVICVTMVLIAFIAMIITLIAQCARDKRKHLEWKRMCMEDAVKQIDNEGHYDGLADLLEKNDKFLNHKK